MDNDDFNYKFNEIYQSLPNIFSETETLKYDRKTDLTFFAERRLLLLLLFS